MPDLPTGTVTFLFTDIEGSTRLLQRLGIGYRDVLEDHNRLLRDRIRAVGGIDLRTEGDAVFAVFASTEAAISAAVAGQRALAGHSWPEGVEVRVRMGLHTGEGVLGGDEYVGLDVHRAARIVAAAHGGQILLSGTTRALVEHTLPDGVELRDLGQHRLKDMAHPERLHDLVIEGLESEFPPLRTLEVPTNLPAEVTSFVGREWETGAIEGLLSGSRLVTLTGPGGTGKTRLAVHVAAGLIDRYPDGVVFVELSPVTDSSLVPSSIAAAMGIREQAFAHSATLARPIQDVVAEHLRDRTTLLVLDNFEQVLDAAPVVADLVSAAPHLRVLATSRAALRIRGEQVFRVPPLDAPDPDRLPGLEELARFESLTLFTERGTTLDPEFALNAENAPAVAQICARLDGLPLAIELAASRITVLSPEAILTRLDERLPFLTHGPRDAPERQRTLRAAIQWSYELLSEGGRELFRRLSAFLGGWTLGAAEAVSNPNGELGLDTLEGLGLLVDNSLIRKRAAPGGTVRFDMLQSFREYGLETLEAEEDGHTIRRRHAEVFLALAEESEHHLRGHEENLRLGILDLEHDNIRAALRWAIEEDVGEIGLRLVGSLWRFWHLRGHLTEGRRWAEEVLALPSSSGRTLARARAFTAAGGLAYWQNDVPAVSRAYEEALALYRELDDRPGIALGTFDLSFARALEGDGESTVALMRESANMFRELGDSQGVADCLWEESLVARLQGHHQTAVRLAEESLRMHRERGDRFGMNNALNMLGRAAFDAGDLDTARASFLETMASRARMGDLTGITIALDNIAAQANTRGQPVRAVKMAAASAAIKESRGGQAPPELIDLPDPRAVARATLSEEEIAAAWEDGRAMSLEETLAYAREEG
jgi:predicted ATPase/class 3 adenylate cyclase